MVSRRQFLQAGAAAGLASCPGAVFAQGVGMPAPFDDYRALVCVFLFGGNDSFNMLVPRSAAEHAAYAASRQNLAIERAALLPINPATPDGAQYGLHPAMPGVQSLFESGRAAFVTNVGPLIRPTTREQFLAGAVPLPPQLFSHNDQQDQWHSLKGRNVTRTGWAGRVADLVRAAVSDQRMATNASLFGTSLYQSAEQTVAYVMGPGGPVQFEGFGTTGVLLEQRRAFERIIGADYDTVYERAYAEIQQRAVASADRVGAALAGAPVLATAFPATPLGRQLETVARLVAVRDELAMQRQIFFVAAGGFDTHDNQVADQPGLLGGVSEALAAFYSATAELGIAESVTSFTQSDFGRTLTSNGDGTDHAWGGNQLVVGGAVRGQELYGRYPLLEIGGPDDVGGGRMIPTTSADQYAATLARWFGIDDADLDIVAPAIANFAERDLGFLP
ncbi:MAG: DUF1501 domain-containing protein [Woeseiaceae bacterium]|nr:DUF1501 domain-containing protein [Woeseiaceae bacterium]